MAFDIKKEINEMKYYLSNKLKSSIENKDKAKNKIKSKTKGKDKLLINKIHTLWTKYYAKFYKTLNIPDKEQALIKMYSNYKALKVIGNVCKEILDETNDGEKVLSDEEIREFMGALDVAKLAKEQKKFELRAKHGKFSIKNGETKIAEILNASKKMSIKTTKTTFTAPTPFGEINICCEENNDGSETRMIRLPGQTTNEPYIRMAKLDDALNKLNQSTKEDLIECIKDYITKKVQFNENDDADALLKKLKFSEFTGFNSLEESVKKEAKNAAAILCGCLLFAESSEVRNPTRGKLEKKAIKKVGRLIKQDCTNPFGVVFANESPCYYDDTFYSRKKPTSTYTPAKSNPNGNEGSKWEKGGQYQTEWLIKGKANISRDILDKQPLKIYKFYCDNIENANKIQNKSQIIVNYHIEPKIDNLLNIFIKNKLATDKETANSLLLKLAESDDEFDYMVDNLKPGPCFELTVKILKNIVKLDGGNRNLNNYETLYNNAENKNKNIIRINKIPIAYKDAKDYMKKCITENRKNLYELNKKPKNKTTKK